jgi:hypothetical protein
MEFTFAFDQLSTSCNHCSKRRSCNAANCGDIGKPFAHPTHFNKTGVLLTVRERRRDLQDV